MSEDKKIIVDDDWKAQAKKEKEKLSGKETGQSKPAGSPADNAHMPESSQLPPVDFTVLVNSFAMQAMMCMGLIANPMSGKAEKDLEAAKHYIDLLGMLEEKTKGNLTDDENKILAMSLHDLRMAFVETSK